MYTLPSLPVSVQVIAAVSAAIVAAALIAAATLVVRRLRRPDDTPPTPPTPEEVSAVLDAEAAAAAAIAAAREPRHAFDDTPTTAVHRPVRLPGGHYVQPRPGDGGRLARHAQPARNVQPVWLDARHPLAPVDSATVRFRHLADPLRIVETPPRRHSATHPDGIPVVEILTRWGLDHLEDPTEQMQAVTQ